MIKTINRNMGKALYSIVALMTRKKNIGKQIIGPITLHEYIIFAWVFGCIVSALS